MNPDYLIQTVNLAKSFDLEGVKTTALSSLNLSIRRNEFVAVMGPSGSGKSTLLSLLGLLDEPTSGEYYLDGRLVSRLPHREIARIRNDEIGFIFQSYNLVGDLTVFENVELPLIYRKVAAPERKRRVMMALDRLGMAERKHHLPGQLSGGQQQRVAIGRAVACAPKVILADEPTGNLDSENGERVMNLLKELHAEGATVCMVTHYDKHSAFASRVIRILDGKVVDDNGPVSVANVRELQPA